MDWFKPPLYSYKHMKGDFEAIYFKLGNLYPYIFFGRGILALIYINGVLFFGSD